MRYLLPLVTGLAALVVYLLTMAPDLTWAHFGSDGGELITAAVTTGIPHPPGYPTYVILGKLASLVPLGTIAWRFNLFSAVCASAAVSFVCATLLDLLPSSKNKEIVSIAAALCAAFAPLFWGQALIAEVYALNILFLSIFLWSLRGGRAPILGVLV